MKTEIRLNPVHHLFEQLVHSLESKYKLTKTPNKVSFQLSPLKKIVFECPLTGPILASLEVIRATPYPKSEISQAESVSTLPEALAFIKTCADLHVQASTEEKQMKIAVSQSQPKVIIAASLNSSVQFDQWAVDMHKVINAISKCSIKELGLQDGVYKPKAIGTKMIGALKAAGYKPYEQIDDFWVIESLKDKKVGITIDFREDMTGDLKQCIVQFFRDE